jgi:aryl-alcohol dehydrogenase-like predicted oxidoreductase
VIATKTFNPMEPGADSGLKRERVSRQLETSLDRLGVEHVEVYLAHDFDRDTPLEESVATFAGLEELGLVKAWGVSNFDADQLRRVFELARPALVQNSYSLLERGDEDEVLELCKHFDVCYTPFGPLAGGLLTGKYRSREAPPPGSRLATRPGPYEHLLTDETFAKLEKFTQIAAERGVSPATLAIAWLLAQPAVTAVVVGPRRVEHLEPAVAALECNLSREEADALAELF